MIIGLSGYIGSGKDTVGTIIQYLTTQKETISYTGSFNSYIMDIGMGGDIVSRWKVKKFAGKLKEIATMLTGIPTEDFESQEVKSGFLGKEWDSWVVSWKHGDDGPGSIGFKTEQEAIDFMDMNFEDGYDEKMVKFTQMTVREFLQKLGTEAIRNNIHRDAWVNALFADYKPIGGWPEYGVTEEGDRIAIGYNSIYPDWLITDTRFPNEAKAIKDMGGVVVRINRPVVGKDWNPPTHPSEISLDDWDFDYAIDNDGSIDDLISKVKVMMETLKIM